MIQSWTEIDKISKNSSSRLDLGKVEEKRGTNTKVYTLKKNQPNEITALVDVVAVR